MPERSVLDLWLVTGDIWENINFISTKPMTSFTTYANLRIIMTLWNLKCMNDAVANKY